uniref:Mitochondrial inner membrane protease ATP23 n=1 Tax=Oryza punctata TaxID=4537 RepID=A0A0E0MLG8_ORYPU
MNTTVPFQSTRNGALPSAPLAPLVAAPRAHAASPPRLPEPRAPPTPLPQPPPTPPRPLVAATPAFRTDDPIQREEYLLGAN